VCFVVGYGEWLNGKWRVAEWLNGEWQEANGEWREANGGEGRVKT